MNKLNHKLCMKIMTKKTKFDLFAKVEASPFPAKKT